MLILSALLLWISKAGVAVNAADFKGLTPLMTAAMFGRSASAAYLLGMEALNHLTDINGDSALHWAAYKGILFYLMSGLKLLWSFLGNNINSGRIMANLLYKFYRILKIS